MSRQQFTARNNIGSVLTFQKSGATASFDPTITFSSGSRRVSWKLNNGTNTTQTAGNSIIYTGFTSDPEIRTIEMRGNSFRGVTMLDLSEENLYGHINLTPLSGLGGEFYINNNLLLTGITHSTSTSSFTTYQAYYCGLTGVLDLTPLSGLGGGFFINNNTNLTGILHSVSPNLFTQYRVENCDLTGNLDLTPLSGLGGDVAFSLNPLLTSVTHTMSVQNIHSYQGFGCGLLGTLDLSPLTKLGSVSGLGVVRIHDNNNLTNVIFPTTTQSFGNLRFGSMISIYNCDLNYVDFKPLSGATTANSPVRPSILLQNNNMLAADVNHILVDFSNIVSYNPTGWSNITLNISGTNAPPDSTSGGYNGLAAISFLTGSPYNWTITHS